jgi:hypothetical protein
MIMDSKFQISQLLLHISRANEKGIQLFWHDLGAEHKNRYRKIITSKKIYSFVIARNNMRDAIMVFKASLKRRLSVALASERPPAALKKGPL